MSEDAEKPVPPGDEPFVLVDRVVDPYLVLFHDPGGFRAEQFRALRNKLVVLNPEGLPRSLLVTSAVQGEGKTVTALNLGFAFAELENTRAILLDFDLRQPAVTRFLGLEPAPGLVEILTQGMPLAEGIRPTGREGFDFVGAGLARARPGELLGSSRIDELVAALKEEYSYILLDSPPVIPVSDAGLLAARADGTLFVVRLEVSPKKLVKQALENLRELGANVLGTFVVGLRGADPAYDERYRYPDES